MKWRNRFRKIHMRKLLIGTFVIFMMIPFAVIFVIYLNVSQEYAKKSYGNYLSQSLTAVQKQIDDSCERLVDGTMNFYHNGMVELLANHSVTESDRLIIQSKLEDILNSFSGSVSAIFIKQKDKIYSTGVAYQDVLETVEPYEEKIIEKKGRHIWIAPCNLLPKKNSGTKVILGKSLNGTNKKNIAQAYLVIDVEEFTDAFDQKELAAVSKYLFDANQNQMYQQSTDDNKMKLNQEQLNTAYKDSYDIVKFEHTRYLFVQKQSRKTNWISCISIPMKEVVQDFNPIKVTMGVLAGIYLLFLLAMLFLLEKYMVLPVKSLARHMDSFAGGNFDISIEAPAIGELDSLNQHFNQMTVRIMELIKRNEQEVQEKNEFKMQTLRAQLSPHFMYNSLNTIKWMAVINKQENIEKLTGALIQLLMSHTKGKEENYKLKDEILLIQNYAVIQKARFMNFDIRFQIEEDVMECSIVKFLLQPIVENAIIHGFARGKKRRGIITITACKDPELYIWIEDNGIGFDVEKWKNSEKILSEDHTNIAINNISQIILLEYGSAYGITIESEPGRGTKVVYHLPLPECE